MKDATRDAKFKRLCDALKCDSYTKLAQKLGITSQAVYDAKKRGVIPQNWLVIASHRHLLDVSEWPKFLDNEAIDDSQAETPGTKDDNIDYASLLAKIFSELEIERAERRELAAEHRQILKENGELKAQIARLEERLKAVNGGRGESVAATKASSA